MRDITREQFEEWADSQGLIATKDSHGIYDQVFTDRLWQAWKASRKSLTDMLPDPLFKLPNGQEVYLRSEVERFFEKNGVAK